MNDFRLVVLESPFKGDIERNKAYLDECIHDCIINHKDSPFASHKLYTDSLDDGDEVERDIGIKCGLAWGEWAQAVVVYTDYGISDGMKTGIAHYESMGIPVEYRELY